MMPNVQMCGFLYTGADLCGFGGDTTPDLALRWLEFGILTPLMRNHASTGTREQEYYRFERELPAIRKLLRLRGVDDYDEEILSAGHHYVRCALDEVLLFLRPDHIVPVAKNPASNTAQPNEADLTLWSYLPDGQAASYRMYTDDGVSLDYDDPAHWRIVK